MALSQIGHPSLTRAKVESYSLELHPSEAVSKMTSIEVSTLARVVSKRDSISWMGRCLGKKMKRSGLIIRTQNNSKTNWWSRCLLILRLGSHTTQQKNLAWLKRRALCCMITSLRPIRWISPQTTTISTSSRKYLKSLTANGSSVHTIWRIWPSTRAQSRTTCWTPTTTVITTRTTIRCQRLMIVS